MASPADDMNGEFIVAKGGDASKGTAMVVLLLGGSVFMYNSEKSSKPAISIEDLNQFRVVRPKRGQKQKRTKSNGKDEADPPKRAPKCIQLTTYNGETAYTLTSETVDLALWSTALEAHMELDPKKAPKRKKEKGKVGRLKDRTKKNVAGKAANSSIGKKALRSQTPDEMKELIESLKNIVFLESSSKKIAAGFEDDAYRVGIKVFFCIDAEHVAWNDIIKADLPLRAGLELLAVSHDHARYARVVNEEKLLEKLRECEGEFIKAADQLAETLEPFMKPKNLKKIKQILDQVGTAEILHRAFLNEEAEEDVQRLVNAGVHYTQFHLYPDD